MKNALKNPHYKKIWEKVIMNRHPQANNLDRALEMEAKHSGCYISVITSPHAPQYRKTEIATILWDDGIDSASNKRWYCFRNSNIDPHTFTTVQKQDTVLGRLITLEDILILFTKRTSIFSKIQDKLQGFSVRELQFYILEFLGSWQLTKPLHEQTPETWEKIAKII